MTAISIVLENMCKIASILMQKIEISFENGTSNLVIRDNGSGMDREELIHSLGIGVSNKSEEDIGWRGVGIWSGVPVCRRIVIITKKKEKQ